MAHQFVAGKFRAWDSNGVLLAGGKLYSYSAGTSTPLATYTDKTENSTNNNPVVLDAAGEANVWLGASSYKFILKDSNDVVQWTEDNVSHINTGSVITSKLADGSVTTAKLADGAVTQAKLAAKTVGSAALTIGTVTSTTPAAVTGSLSFTTSTRPVIVSLAGKYSGAASYLKITGPASSGAKAVLELYRGSTRISSQVFGVKPSQVSQTFTSSGTYVVPSGVTEMWVNGCGGGGGGCSSAQSTTGGGGGGGSAGRLAKISVTPGETLTIAIGAYGAAGAYIDLSTQIAGSAGGDTTITNGSSVVIYRAKGGGGGQTSGGAGTQWGDGGTGGANNGTGQANRANAAIAGGAAGASGGSASGGGGGGAGLSGAGGAGGDGRASNPGTIGSDGTGYGSGGGGSGGSGDGTRSQPGGNGAPGYLELLDSPSMGGTHEFYIPASAIQAIDNTGVAASVSYTLQASVSTAGATLTAAGEIDIQAVEF